MRDDPLFLNMKSAYSKFSVFKFNNELIIKSGKAKPFGIKVPFILDEDVAKLAAMLLDGSLAKCLGSIMFCQKKDISKMTEVLNIVTKKFTGLSPKKYIRDGTIAIVISNKSFCTFLHHCLDFYKCDESARIPKWVWKSPHSIIKEYVRYAFAMEGSIKDPCSGHREIRFHSCDFDYTKELKKFLKIKFKVKSRIQRYYIKNYGWKYYLSIGNKEDITQFSKIGFAIKSHQDRLDRVVKSYKPPAWKLTLAEITKLDKPEFSNYDLRERLPNLCKRSIHYRLTKLVKLGYLSLNNKYKLTESGKIVSLNLQNLSQIQLRTNKSENEKRVFNLLVLRPSSRNQIARELGLHFATVRDTLLRLAKKQLVIKNPPDKFQRCIWNVTKIAGEGITR